MNDEKRAHLVDIRCEHLIDQVCPQESTQMGGKRSKRVGTPVQLSGSSDIMYR
jgi:hypothetical protein